MKYIRLFFDLLLAFLLPGVNTTSFPAHITPVNQLTPTADAQHGLLAFLANANAQDSASLVSIAYGAATSLTLTGAQFVNAVWDLSGSGVLALTMPSVANILAALPATIPKDGFAMFVYVMNDSTGQTITVTGTTNVTVVGTATVATATTRLFLVNINVNSGTVNMVNLGTMSL